MKPVSLAIKGFRSHEHDTEISFAGRRLFAIVGPTGAGKSSILDAVSYALYGATPRIRRNVKKLICTRADSAHVRFVFEVEGHEHEITRSLRRSGAGEHVLVDGSSGQRVIGEGKVNEKVAELLGLDFDAFCSSVLLAQGKFSEFLEASPTTRSQILKGVFRLDQIDALRDAAKARRNELEGEVARVEGRRAHIPEDVDARLEAAIEAHASCTARVAVLEKAVPKERKLLVELERSAEAGRAAEAAYSAAAEAVAAAPRPAEVDELARRVAEVTAPLVVAEEALAGATAARDTARKTLAELESTLGSTAVLIETRVQAQVIARGASLLTRYAAGVAETEAKLESAAAAATEAGAFEQQALDSLEKTRGEREAIERSHQAHVLRDALAVGEPCPVCEQKVSVLPRGDRPAELAAVRKSEADAKKLYDAAVKSARAAATELTQAEGELAAARRRVTDEEEKLVAGRAAVAEVVGDVSDPVAEVERRLAQLTAAAERLSVAEAAVESARSELAARTEAKRALDAASTRLVAQLSHVAGSLGVPPPPHDSAVGELAVAAADLRSAAEAAREKAGAAVSAARTAEERASAQLAKLREGLGLDAGAPVERAVKVAIRTATEAEGQEKTLRALLEESKLLDRQEKQLKETLGLYVQLADDMTDKNFIRFMLEEKRRLLSEIGSQRLREMTRRYRFDDRGEFNVIDELNADKERTVDTLSGGETFLASLALSLALAEAVTRHGGRLQCFFLDEGFGSLDPEALDSALEGIEHIVTEDRLIGLVSHVEALRNRVEDKIVLDKDDDGMTRVIAGATLG